jgi:hypothetical protein
VFARPVSVDLVVRNVCQIPDAEDFALKDLGNVHARREKADNCVKKVHEQRGDWRVGGTTGQLSNPPKVGQLANKVIFLKIFKLKNMASTTLGDVW